MSFSIIIVADVFHYHPILDDFDHSKIGSSNKNPKMDVSTHHFWMEIVYYEQWMILIITFRMKIVYWKYHPKMDASCYQFVWMKNKYVSVSKNLYTINII